MLQYLMAKFAYLMSESSANETCFSWFYQPKLPDKVKKLKKTKKGV